MESVSAVAVSSSSSMTNISAASCSSSSMSSSKGTQMALCCSAVINMSAPSYCVNSRSSGSSLVRTQPTSSLLFVAPATGALLHRRTVNSDFPLSHSGPAVRTGGFNVVTSQAKSEDVDAIGAVGVGAIVGSLVANPVVWWSLYTLKTTGCGLPPGPGGSIGAIEGVSYLVISGLIGWSIFTKVKTGSGLPQGPFGLLGAVEGISYLTLLAIVVVFGLQALDFGFIPGPLPGKECFG